MPVGHITDMHKVEGGIQKRWQAPIQKIDNQAACGGGRRSSDPIGVEGLTIVIGAPSRINRQTACSAKTLVRWYVLRQASSGRKSASVPSRSAEQPTVTALDV